MHNLRLLQWQSLTGMTPFTGIRAVRKAGGQKGPRACLQARPATAGADPRAPQPRNSRGTGSCAVAALRRQSRGWCPGGQLPLSRAGRRLARPRPSLRPRNGRGCQLPHLARPSRRATDRPTAQRERAWQPPPPSSTRRSLRQPASTRCPGAGSSSAADAPPRCWPAAAAAAAALR